MGAPGAVRRNRVVGVVNVLQSDITYVPPRLDVLATCEFRSSLLLQHKL